MLAKSIDIMHYNYSVSSREKSEFDKLCKFINEFQRRFFTAPGATTTVGDYFKSLDENRRFFNDMGFSEEILDNIQFTSADPSLEMETFFKVFPCKDLPLLSSLALSHELLNCRHYLLGLSNEKNEVKVQHEKAMEKLSQCKDPEFVKKDIQSLKSRTYSRLKRVEKHAAEGVQREKSLVDFCSEIGVLDMVNELVEQCTSSNQKPKARGL